MRKGTPSLSLTFLLERLQLKPNEVEQLQVQSLSLLFQLVFQGSSGAASEITSSSCSSKSNTASSSSLVELLIAENAIQIVAFWLHRPNHGVQSQHHSHRNTPYQQSRPTPELLNNNNNSNLPNSNSNSMQEIKSQAVSLLLFIVQHSPAIIQDDRLLAILIGRHITKYLHLFCFKQEQFGTAATTMGLI